MAEQSITDVFNNLRKYPVPATFNERLQALAGSLGVDFSTLVDLFQRRTTPFFHSVDAVAASGSESVIFKAPFPMKLRAFQTTILGLNSAATLTADILVNKAGAGYVTILDPATDIKTAIAAPAEYAPENTTAINALCILDRGDLVKYTYAAGSGGNPDNIHTLTYWEHPNTSE